ncbi:MAG: ROK family protein [Phycisphaerales bacterium]
MAQSDLVVGVDLGGTNIAAGVVDRKGRISGRAKKKTKASEGRDAVVERIVAAVEEACADAKIRISDLAAIGVGAPGPVDFGKGIVITAGNLGWKNVALGELLRKRTGLPVSVDNDVNVAAWGEATIGAGDGCESLLAVWVGTGVGGGLVLGKRLWRGDLHTAGEIGQTIVYPNGQPGSTTLEEFCSRTGMARSIATRAGFHPDSLYHKVVARMAAEGKTGPIGSSALAQCYEAGDALVVQVVNAAADLLGIAIANCVTVLSVRTIVLGGGVTEAFGKAYVARVEEQIKRHVFPTALAPRLSVRMTKLKDAAGVQGAAMLAWSEL